MSFYTPSVVDPASSVIPQSQALVLANPGVGAYASSNPYAIPGRSMYPLQYGYPQSMQMVVQPQHPMMYQSGYHMSPYAHQPYGYGMGAGMVVQDPYGYSRRRHRRHRRYSYGGYPSYPYGY